MRKIEMVSTVEVFDESIHMTVDLYQPLTIHELWNCLSRAGIRPSEITVGLGRGNELARVVLSEDRRKVDYYRSKDRLSFAMEALGGTIREAHVHHEIVLKPRNDVTLVPE
jgi:hypothetical protein